MRNMNMSFRKKGKEKKYIWIGFVSPDIDADHLIT